MPTVAGRSACRHWQTGRVSEHPAPTRVDADPVVDVTLDDGSGDGGTGDDVIVLSWWQHPVNVVTLLVATLLIAGMVGWMAGAARNDVATSDVDRGFLWDMRAHHEQAVLMSDIFLSRPDISSGMSTIARSVRFGQSIEIGVMIRLLEEMGAEQVSPEGTAMSWMNDGVGMMESEMPGMATEAQLDALMAARGAEADALFAELMIAHHEGGMHMMQHAAEHAENPDVRRFAAAWEQSQRDEIAEIRSVLASSQSG